MSEDVAVVPNLPTHLGQCVNARKRRTNQFLLKNQCC